MWFSIISSVVAATMLFDFKPHDLPSTNAHTWSHERTRRHTIAHAQVTCSLIFLPTKQRNINYQCVCETFLMSCSLQCQKWYAQTSVVRLRLCCLDPEYSSCFTVYIILYIPVALNAPNLNNSQVRN